MSASTLIVLEVLLPKEVASLRVVMYVGVITLLERGCIPCYRYVGVSAPLSFDGGTISPLESGCIPVLFGGVIPPLE